MIPPLGDGPVRVDAEKVRDYLLNATHPENGGKAALFMAFGFTQTDWPILSKSLASHIVANPPNLWIEGLHGTKLVSECSMQTPDGRNPCVTTVWILDKGRDKEGPRFVTCYAGPSRSRSSASTP